MTDPELQLRLPARPENVALVRQVLAGIADAIHVEPALLADIKTAVTEACNNVVLHAYPDEPDGLLEVDARPSDQYVAIVVRDYGGGMQPHASGVEEPAPGLGLPLIAALTDRYEIHGGGGRGIEVRMVFMLADLPDIPANGAVRASAPDPPAEDSLKGAGVAITPGPMMAPVLGRLTAMLAARADFSLERLSDAVLVTDAIAASISSFIPDRHAWVVFEDGDQKIEMTVGPLVQGGGDELLRTMQLPGFDRSLEQLVDDVRVESSGDDEYVHVTVSNGQ
jgi:serine/threonine-protein kinase RsbW